MKLTVKTDYCLRVLIYVQQHKGRVKIKEIADDYQISKNHLSVAVNTLSELGYLHSTSGPNGGIEFNPDFAEKTIAELISKIENLNLVECHDVESDNCTLSPHCRLKTMLRKAGNSFVNELKKYKIKDLS